MLLTDKRDVRELYKKHPLRQETILARVLRRRGTTDGLTELDFALDEDTGITDQNHVGGLAFTAELACYAGVASDTRVLDLGCGLGGLARSLAHLCRCHVHGVELSEQRVQDTVELTRRVGLDDLVSFECRDVLDMEVPDAEFDILWGQSSWTHFRDKEQFLHRWSAALDGSGRLAFEDLYLKRRPRTAAEVRDLDEFERDTLSSIVSPEQWEDILTHDGFTIALQQDLSDFLLQESEQQSRETLAPERDNLNELEKSGLLLKLAREEILGYCRIITC
jgi:cyclopropane fatty-acyl-phospholipid synthase-like methyltransferase